MRRKSFGQVMLAWSCLLAIPPFTGSCATTDGQEAPEIVWPGPPDATRIRFVRSYEGSQDVEAEKGFFGRMMAGLVGEDPPTKFKKPYAVYVDRGGRIFVSDSGWACVLMLDPQAHEFKFIGQEGQNALVRPTGLIGDSDGNLYVADGARSTVNVYDKDGKFVSAYGGADVLARPGAVGLSKDGKGLYVVDAAHHQIFLFDRESAKLIKTIGERGNQDGQFNFPTQLAFGPDGRMYVTDTMNFRVQIFDDDQFVGKIGSNCDNPGCMPRSKGIGVDSDGYIHVVDAAMNAVQIFNEEGAFLLPYGMGGHGPGNLWLPAGAYLTPDNTIYVVDQYNWRVNVYQYISDAEAAASAGPDAAPAEGGADSPPKAKQKTTPAEETSADSVPEGVPAKEEPAAEDAEQPVEHGGYER